MDSDSGSAEIYHQEPNINLSLNDNKFNKEKSDEELSESNLQFENNSSNQYTVVVFEDQEYNYSPSLNSKFVAQNQLQNINNTNQMEDLNLGSPAKQQQYQQQNLNFQLSQPYLLNDQQQQFQFQQYQQQQQSNKLVQQGQYEKQNISDISANQKSINIPDEQMYTNSNINADSKELKRQKNQSQNQNQNQNVISKDIYQEKNNFQTYNLNNNDNNTFFSPRNMEDEQLIDPKSSPLLSPNLNRQNNQQQQQQQQSLDQFNLNHTNVNQKNNYFKKSKSYQNQIQNDPNFKQQHYNSEDFHSNQQYNQQENVQSNYTLSPTPLELLAQSQQITQQEQFQLEQLLQNDPQFLQQFLSQNFQQDGQNGSQNEDQSESESLNWEDLIQQLQQEEQTEKNPFEKLQYLEYDYLIKMEMIFDKIISYFQKLNTNKQTNLLFEKIDEPQFKKLENFTQKDFIEIQRFFLKSKPQEQIFQKEFFFVEKTNKTTNYYLFKKSQDSNNFNNRFINSIHNNDQIDIQSFSQKFQIPLYNVNNHKEQNQNIQSTQLPIRRKGSNFPLENQNLDQTANLVKQKHGLSQFSNINNQKPQEIQITQQNPNNSNNQIQGNPENNTQQNQNQLQQQQFQQQLQQDLEQNMSKTQTNKLSYEQQFQVQNINSLNATNSRFNLMQSNKSDRYQELYQFGLYNNNVNYNNNNFNSSNYNNNNIHKFRQSENLNLAKKYDIMEEPQKYQNMFVEKLAYKRKFQFIYNKKKIQNQYNTGGVQSTFANMYK
ncbi:hypothetical protein PPERSA_09138 [Pseudocohnilembus persalinus]|uniref:Uncharacterized protein n=1 Tax=Pseudocohnilembus persalinus TaxID=266149 RepID=A0A0V0QXH8_PSEPJ|nr:hypothetical protein PPERSA_09138 [Pseudocohnilembus persalinus]|eukprot:KRX06736.1 hypothetical protein PPERSA_09138 [Pseudocohnilembus persalinus]